MPPKNTFANINALWANLLIEELIRNGVDCFCIAPGSRSTPLAIAVAQNPHAHSTVHFDERGLGFYALGNTVATQKPTVIITTSGTAVANLFPSIVEASKKKLPLIILTADRPPELRSTGANQTIDQIKIFGDYVRFFFDLPCPSTDIPPEFVLTTINQALFRAKGELYGPVHLNCMFREPLAPNCDPNDFSFYLESLSLWLNHDKPYTQYESPDVHISIKAIDQAADILKTVKQGIIAVGKISGKKDEAAILALARNLNWPIFADITSGLKLGQKHEHIIHHFDHILNADDKFRNIKPDGVLHFGGRLTSTHWYRLIKRRHPRHYLMILKHPLRNDPEHRVTMRLQGNISHFCKTVIPKISQRPSSLLFRRFQKQDMLCEKIINDTILKTSALINEPAVARIVSQLIPKNSGLFISNSMPIRDMNHFASKEGSSVFLTANRGASGIDGNIATTAGFAKGLKKPCTALLGDLAFLHDLNSLSLIQNIKYPLVLIVINNKGGAIFSFLPIAKFNDGFNKFFTAEHQWTFEHAAALFKISYKLITHLEDFQKTYEIAIKTPKATILEIQSDSIKNHTCHCIIAEKIRNIL